MRSCVPICTLVRSQQNVPVEDGLGVAAVNVEALGVDDVTPCSKDSEEPQEQGGVEPERLGLEFNFGHLFIINEIEFGPIGPK